MVQNGTPLKPSTTNQPNYSCKYRVLIHNNNARRHFLLNIARFVMDLLAPINLVEMLGQHRPSYLWTKLSAACKVKWSCDPRLLQQHKSKQ